MKVFNVKRISIKAYNLNGFNDNSFVDVYYGKKLIKECLKLSKYYDMYDYIMSGCNSMAIVQKDKAFIDFVDSYEKRHNVGINA